MKRTFLYVGVAAALFGASAAGSWFLQRDDSTHRPASNATAPLLELTSAALEPDASESSGELPVAVRPRPMNAEEIVRYGLNIRSREETLQQREEALERERAQLKLVIEDIRAEQRELEALQGQIQNQLLAAEKLISEVAAQRQRFLEERQNAEDDLEKIRKAQIEYKSLESENLKRMSAWFQNMEPEKAAEYLRELANDGKITIAVQLLGNFEEREAAKILAAMDDKALVVQLTNEFRGLKRAEKTPKRR